MEFEMNNQLIYENPKLFNQQEVNKVIKSNNISDICKMLAGVSLYSEDIKLIEDTILKCIYLENIEIVSMCITALNHFARRYINEFNQEKWLNIVSQLKYKNDLINQIKELISDIEFYSRIIISTDLLNIEIKEKNMNIKIIECYEKNKQNEKSFILYYVDNQSKKECFNGEYQDLQELIDDIKDELGIIIHLSNKSYSTIKSK